MIFTSIGFVSFTTPEEAAIAAAEMNNTILLTRPLSVVIQQSKEERHAQLEVEFSGHQGTYMAGHKYFTTRKHLV